MERDAASEVREQVLAAIAARLPLAIGGGGTKSFYGREAAGAPLDMSAHAGILSHDPAELVLTARAGTRLADIEAALAESGQCMPFEPPRFGDAATLGGTVACGIAGPARAYAGAVKDFVLGVTLMNGEGKTLRFGGQVMKNVAGYDISRMLVGSLGTLGILMDVSMPNVGGVEATRRIVQNEPQRRVVMLTMHADRDVIESAIKAGAVGYLTKDCSIDEVIEAVRMADSGETALSPLLAQSMLTEVRRIDSSVERDEDRLISPREEEVLQLIAEGCSTPEVADRLYISQKTVKNHLASIYEKLNARDRTQAVLTAVRMGIVKLN